MIRQKYQYAKFGIKFLKERKSVLIQNTPFFSVSPLWYTLSVSMLIGVRQASHLRGLPFKTRPVHWVLFFTLIGFGLRVQRLDFQPLWGDEGWSFYFVMQPLGQLLDLTAVDIHPPLYYILLKAWLMFTGTGAETARLFSVGVGTLQIVVVALLGRRWFNRRVGLTAGAMVAIMPLAIYYAQEVRMYGLVTLLGAMSVYFLVRIEADANTRHVSDSRSAGQHAEPRFHMIAYVAVTTAALYTHYYAVLIVVAQLLYVISTGLKRKQGSGFWSDYTGLIYLPWLVFAGSRLTRYIENKRDIEAYAPLNLGRFISDHFVAFSLGHLAPDVVPVYVWTALVLVSLALLGFIATLYPGRTRPVLLYLYLLVPLLIGYVINLIYPFTPRYFERTLLLAAPAYWLFVAVGLGWLWSRHYLLVGTAAALVALVISVSLSGFYTVARYPDQDYRPLLTDIAAQATPDDTLLASYQWQLGFYHAYLPASGPKLVTVPGWGRGWSSQTAEASTLSADLTRILDESPRLWFPAYQASGHIWEDETEAAIAQAGYPALLRWYNPDTKLTLAGRAQQPLHQAPPANFENRLDLLEAMVGGDRYEAGRDVVPVTLVWQKRNGLESEHRVSLRLADATGRTWATRDSQPRAGQRFFTDMLIDDRLVDQHGLLTPAGAPPGNYRLLLSVRRVDNAHPLDILDEAGQPLGAELLLAEITLTAPDPPLGTAALPVQVARADNFDRSARLVGYSLGDDPFKPGEHLPLTLFWESLAENPGPLLVLVKLQDDSGRTVVSRLKEPIWPATNWRKGTLVRDPQDLALPARLAPGAYQLSISLLGPDQAPSLVDGQPELALTTVTTTERPRNFERPDPQIDLAVSFGDQARLIGLDLPQTEIPAGEMVPLRLYWQAISTIDKNLTVFVHVTDRDGLIISQQDQIPGSGQIPTTSWVPDEFIIDDYTLHIPAETPAGDRAYQLEIGLYDAIDFSRLPVLNAGEIIGDHVTLSSWPISIE
jgi:4-amino-4-deoxy-L-arabinose transferase-like glycosyltransferase